MYSTFRIFKFSISTTHRYFSSLNPQTHELQNADIYVVPDEFKHFFRTFAVCTGDTVQIVQNRDIETKEHTNFEFFNKIKRKIEKRKVLGNSFANKSQIGDNVEQKYERKKDENKNKKDQRGDEKVTRKDEENIEENVGENFTKRVEKFRRVEIVEKTKNSSNFPLHTTLSQRQKSDNLVILTLTNIFSPSLCITRTGRSISLNDLKLKMYTEEESKMFYDHLNTQFIKINKQNDKLKWEEYQEIRKKFRMELKIEERSWEELKEEFRKVAEKEIVVIKKRRIK